VASSRRAKKKRPPSASDLEKGQQKVEKRYARAVKGFKQLTDSRQARSKKPGGGGVKVEAHKRRGKNVKGYTRRK